MPSPDDREPSDLTPLRRLLGPGTPSMDSAIYRLVMYLAVRLADLDIPEEEMRLIRMVRKALDEIAEGLPPPD